MSPATPTVAHDLNVTSDINVASHPTVAQDLNVGPVSPAARAPQARTGRPSRARRRSGGSVGGG